MKKRTGKKTVRKGVWVAALLLAGMLSACGRKTDGENGDMGILGELEKEGEAQESTGGEAGSGRAGGGTEEGMAAGDLGETNAWKEKYGGNCIAEQTFEVEISEYDGTVCFVPYAPDKENADFHMQIVQNDRVLTDIPGYVPTHLEGQTFGSLDAVSFYDINYDGNTDIVLIETYGDTSFAAVYYGFDNSAEEDYEKSFLMQEALSDAITDRVGTVSVSEIRALLSDGKRNGEFDSYQEAYAAVGRLCKLEGSAETEYNLIYFDEDEIPELAAGDNGFYTSLYTYHDGTVYTLMDRWPYGVMGNAGYEYCPRKNSMRNYNTDYAGAILYITYWKMGPAYTMDMVAEIRQMNFDDVNENGVPDEEEMGSLGLYSKSYLNGREATDEECASYDAGDYEFLTVSMSLEELSAK